MKYFKTINFLLKLSTLFIVFYRISDNPLFSDQTLSENEFIRTIKQPKILLTKWENIETKYGFLEGKTIWESDKEPIYGLTILFNPGKYNGKTDHDGNFKVKLPYGKYKVDFYFLNHLLKTDYIVVDSELSKLNYKIPNLPNQTTLEVKDKFN